MSDQGCSQRSEQTHQMSALLNIFNLLCTYKLSVCNPTAHIFNKPLPQILFLNFSHSVTSKQNPTLHVESHSDTSFAQLRILWKNTRCQPFFTENRKLISTVFCIHFDYFVENWAYNTCSWRCWLCVCVWLLYHAAQLLSCCKEGRNGNISLFATFVNVFENSLVSKTFTKP